MSTKMSSKLKFIGKIRTPYRSVKECPSHVDIQGPTCQLVLDDKFRDGLKGLSPGQDILVLYWFENVDRARMVQTPRRGGERRGVFALRSPHRPNPIAASVVTIESIREGQVTVRGMDCLDGTPLLDIKPAS
jgi:tRNA-Thr(GGU) m(6)t(6)A37 methyltransferase TsaA